MATTNLKGMVDITTTPAVRSLRALASTAEALTAATKANQVVTTAQTGALRAQSVAAQGAAKALATVTAAQGAYNKSQQQARLISARATAVNVGTNNSRAVAGGQVALLEARALATATNQQIALDNAAGVAAERAQRMRIAALREARAAQAALNASQTEGTVGLNGMRYVISDVTRGLMAMSVAAAVLPVAAAVTAVSWQKDFASVIRTTGVTGDAVDRLRGQFTNLVQTMPISWAKLTEIGTLAGQIGISQAAIGSFTRAVAMFSSTTDVSVAQAATAFGRLNALVPDVRGNFTGLGDAILKVGVNSVATESSIIKITTQIAATASTAGFTANEIIGLSGALASIGVPPELSRGVITRVFGDINKAVARGGPSLEKWGRAIGVSGEEFRNAWNSDSSDTFQSIMTTLQKQGSGAALTLNDLGITSVRDVPVLIRLANAMDSAGKAGGLLAQTINDANTAGGEMERQYAITSSTVAAKLQVIVQSFQALLDAVGSAALPIFGDILDDWTKKLRDLTRGLSEPVRLLGTIQLPFTGGEALATGVVIASIVAGLGLLLVAFGKVAQGAIAFKVAIASFPGIMGAFTRSAGSASAAAAATATSLNLAGNNAAVAATGFSKGQKAARGFATGLAAIGKAAGVTALLMLPGIIDSINQSLAKAGTSTQDMVGNITNYTDALQSLKGTEGALGAFDFFKNGDKLKQGLNDLNGGFTLDAGTLNNISDANAAIRKLDDAYGTLISSGNGMQAVKQFGDLANSADLTDKQMARLLYTSSNLSAFMKDTLTENGIKITEANLLTLAREGLGGLGVATEQSKADLEAFNEEMDATAEATQESIASLASAASGFVDFGSAIKSATESGTLDIAKFMENIRGMAQAQVEYQTNLASLAATGISDTFMSYLVSMGPEAAGLIKEFVANPQALAEADQIWQDHGTESALKWASSFQAQQDLANQVGKQFGAGARLQLISEMNAAGDDLPSVVSRWNTILEYNKLYPKADISVADDTVTNWMAIQRSITIQVNATNPRTDFGLGDGGINIGPNANGGMYDHVQAFSKGGFATGIYRGGAPMYKFAEQETGWEAFISGRPGEEKRNLGIAYEAINRLGGGMGSDALRTTATGNSYSSQSSRSNSGPTTVIAELSPQDRSLLARLDKPVVFAPSEVAAAANTGNLGRFERGSN